MPKFKFLPLLGTLAVAALIAGSGSARADVEIDFGGATLTGCVTGTGSGDEGTICPNQTFTEDATTFTATGYSDGSNFAAATYLTQKTGIGDETGLGENGTAPGTACTDNPGGSNPATPCEIGVGASVGLTSSIPISDVLIGSVQSGFEQFQVWGFNGTSWSDLSGILSLNGGNGSTACNQVGTASECQYFLTTPLSEIGVVDLAGTPPSDVLLVGVSVVPAPPIGQGLPAVIAVGFLLFGAWAWDRCKKRRLLGAAAIAHAAA